MLTPTQTDTAWRKMAEAEVRSLYFDELATRYSRQKQWIITLSFFLSSGAAITALGQVAPIWVVGLLGLAVAGLTAYSIGFNLEDKAVSMAKLHASWERLAHDYERLWNRWYESDAERVLDELRHRAIELSEAGVKAPYRPDRIKRWSKHVYSSYSHSPSSSEAA